LIKVKKVLNKIDGKWKVIPYKDIDEDSLDGMVIQLSSGKSFTLTERKS